MEALSETTWDVLISGTGLQQSLLALALSRSGKKILHVDRNSYYGGSDAALSIQEVETWVEQVNRGALSTSFRDASIHKAEDEASSNNENASKLSFSRAYSLSLSPELIYSRSSILPILVSSKVYRQLEFQAVGSWWVYDSKPIESVTSAVESPAEDRPHQRHGSLNRVPNGREDVFADKSIDRISKRSLMKFLKFVADFENDPEAWQTSESTPFSEFVHAQFGLSPALCAPLLAISMSPEMPKETTTAYALPSIARHLRSIGVFGPGFGAVVPKWGGAAEIAQVACRAGAVGGGVYVLGRGIEEITSRSDKTLDDESKELLHVKLQDGETVKTRWVAGSPNNVRLPDRLQKSLPSNESLPNRSILKSISIVSSPLTSLFPTTAEGAPPPAGAVMIFPSGSLTASHTGATAVEHPPVHVILHSSDTGECPVGQAVLYASVLARESVDYLVLDRAVTSLLSALEEAKTRPRVLWTLHYTQSSTLPRPSSSTPTIGRRLPDNVLLFPEPSGDSVFDDGVVDRVRRVWNTIRQSFSSGDGVEDEFMVFEDREAVGEEDDTTMGDAD